PVDTRHLHSFPTRRSSDLEKAIAARWGAARLEEQLKAVGGRLQQSPGADAVRPRPLLHACLHFALEQREVGKARQQRADYDHRLDQGLDDDLEGHRDSLQSTRAPSLTARYGGSARTRSPVIASTLSYSQSAPRWFAISWKTRQSSRTQAASMPLRIRCTRPSMLVTVPSFSVKAW